MYNNKKCTKFFTSTVTAVLLGGFVSSASASMINLSTGYSASGPQVDAASYLSTVQTAVAAPSSGYGSTSLAAYDNVTNQSLFGSSGNIAFDTTVNFGVSAAQAGNFEFRFGVDFGWGGAVFLDGVAMAFNSNDMWWNGSYSNPSQYLDFTAILGTGNHMLTVVGLEPCCDGAQQGQFKIGNTAFTTFSSTDGLNAIPEPATVALFAFGLLGLAVSRKGNQF